MEYDNVDRHIDDCIKRLHQYQLDKRRNYLKEQLSRAEIGEDLDPREYRAWAEELAELNKRLNSTNWERRRLCEERDPVKAN